MSNHSPAAQTRLNFRSSPHSSANAARNSIINSSAHGWSPLKIAKREESPLKSPGMSDGPDSPGIDASPRRTSSSFKHVTKNSLVSNSIFKQSNGPAGLTSAEERVIHERAGRRGMGEAPAAASGVASTPKASIGLGISANAKARTTPRSSSGGRSSNGTRRASTDRTREPASGERRVSGERIVSASKENESPDVRSGKRVPRQSMGLKGLARNEYVSKSPFRRVPSGGLSSAASTRANESPTQSSPKSFPIEKDDLFSSPSPASKRRASPSKFRARNTSPTPSPPRGVSQATLASGIVPSPLGQAQTLAPSAYSDMSPSPTPIKSSMTPSKRLRGPRGYSDSAFDSPTKSKTVTFQSVPDVKEFEAVAGEGATPDGSFEQDTQSEGEEDGEWADEDSANHSLEEILNEPETLDKAFGRQGFRVTNPDLVSQEVSDEGHEGVGDESATAEFMDTLISEGLFSPPELSTPAFEDYSQFHLSGDATAPFLSTPSLGDSVHATPMLAGVEPDQSTETDEAGIPYRRTHHAERNAVAHSRTSLVELGPVVEQPAIPHGGDHQMLLNANAAQPALAPASARSDNNLAHQSGPIPDPFLTIQTATNVLTSPTSDREEGGIPLGRTSHIERMQAARMLATQSLGIGMPRSPGVAQAPTLSKAKSEEIRPAQPSFAPSVDEESVDSEMLFDASFEMDMSDEETATPGPTRLTALQQTVEREEKIEAAAISGRRLPKPPKVEEVKLPSPTTKPSSSSESSSPEEVKSNGFDFSEGFSLPSIGLMSPFAPADSATMPSAAPVVDVVEEVNDEPEAEEVRPLTPPPRLGREVREDSPHRIPSFEFKFDSLDLGGDMEEVKKEPEITSAPNRVAPPVVTVTTPKSVNTTPKSIKIERRPRPVSSSSPAPAVKAPTQSATEELGPSSTAQATGSSTTRVRQRISREMIRGTIQQRMADGTLSRHPSSASGHILDAEIPKRRPASLAVTSGLGKDKELPAPPPKTPDLSVGIPMSKAHTTDAPATRKASQADRPIMRPRSKTQSAEEVIQSNVKDDGFIKEPKSALDRLMDGMNSVTLSTSPDRVKAVFAKPISILQKPKDSTLIPPASTHLSAPISPSRATASASPSPSAASSTPTKRSVVTQDKERAVSGKKKDKEGRSRRKSRRSMSTGDVEADAIPVKVLRHSAQPRLTLGLNDAESMLDAFKDETDRIGSERRYKVKEKKVASKYDGLSHGRAGDIDAGASRAWRQLRRPSDMNEHAAELRRLRSKEASAGKASGTVFVKVLGIESLNVPLPDQDTFFCVTLDNGIDYIRTPYIVLKDGARVNQEFSLVESANFEFSLSLDVRKDPHIIKALHEKTSTTTTPTARPSSLLPLSGRETPSSPHRGLRALFGSPRKPRPKSEMLAQNAGFISGSTNSRASVAIPAPAPPKETIAKYLVDDKSPTIGKTHIAFAPIAKNCQAKVLEMRYPVFAMFKNGDSQAQAQAGRARGSSHQPAQVVGEETQRPMIGKITLQIFRLPPLPGLQPDEMPQCIDEALRGMRHHAWHEHEYHEGILTQDGGDCSHPKRRLFKLIGGSLVAINEVTKKQVTSIDLRKAVSVIDLNDSKQASQSQRRKRGSDEGLPIRERSFLVEFNDGEGITFSSDKDEDKVLWLETLNGLVGKIPSNPLWAELLAAQKREEAAAGLTVPDDTIAAATKKVRKIGSSTSLKSKRSASGLPRSTSGLRKKEKEKAK